MLLETLGELGVLVVGFEAAHVLTVVQDAESLEYSMSNVNNKKALTEKTKIDLVVQNG